MSIFQENQPHWKKTQIQKFFFFFKIYGFSYPLQKSSKLFFSYYFEIIVYSREIAKAT